MIWRPTAHLLDLALLENPRNLDPVCTSMNLMKLNYETY
jgi:hypothetical protein